MSTTTSSRKPWIIAVVALAVFVALVAIARTTGNPDRAHDKPAATGKVPNKPGEMPVVRRDGRDPMGMGDPAAPVVLVLWTDLRCPYCAVFNRKVLPIIEKEYIEPGKVRFESNDVAFFGEQSENAAVAARAAGNQGKYFAYTKAVYAEAPEKGHPDLPRDRLVYFAKKAGVPDIARFTRDLDDPALRDKVRQTTDTAQRLGVPSVPFFVAGNAVLSGAQPEDEFRTFLDAAIKNAEK
ncbi:MAG: thioredoxin domain-containing protein [Gordonia sp. (in: high G+C Gram-positive bacteria)]|uniref:DsbA family protein n=1 Tax=Gordonia sp. (in: high G+C Gram-positive bacteria) TaxID=84139 RepID=UPI0039E5E47E